MPILVYIYSVVVVAFLGEKLLVEKECAIMLYASLSAKARIDRSALPILWALADKVDDLTVRSVLRRRCDAIVNQLL